MMRRRKLPPVLTHDPTHHLRSELANALLVETIAQVEGTAGAAAAIERALGIGPMRRAELEVYRAAKWGIRSAESS